MKLKVINRSDFELPKRATEGAAGLDIRANIQEFCEFAPLERKLVPTGLHIQLEEGFEAQIRPRSGLAIKKGLSLLNSPGTIDEDYRGEIKIIMVNLSNETQLIQPGERIAQMVVAKYEKVVLEQVEVLNVTDRNSGGFGHTGSD